MKIAVLGTGVIGTLYGWALGKRYQVYHLVRPEKLEAVQGNKIALDVIDEREKGNEQIKDYYVPNCIATIDNSFDWIIVPVNTYQLRDALILLKKQAPHAKYLIMTLNWNGLEEIEQILEANQYLLGYAGGGGTFRMNGQVKELWGNIGADIMLGKVNEQQSSLLKEAVQMFRRIGIVPETPKNVLHSLWMHNIDSAPLGVGLKKYKDMTLFLEDQELVRLCFKAMQEGFMICEKRGVNLEDYPEVKMYAMSFEQLYPMFKNNFEHNPVMQRYTAHAILAIPEMVDNFKKIYATGKALHLKMPAMTQLYAEM